MKSPFTRQHRPADGSAPGMPKAKAKPRDLEGPIHREILKHLRSTFPGAVVNHCPNSIARSDTRTMRQIQKNRDMGTVKGFPDLQLILPGRVVFFEVKAKGNSADKDQKELHEVLIDLGHPVAVVRSVADTDAALKEWGLA